MIYIMRFFTLTLTFLIAGSLFADKPLVVWPQFRGPNGNGNIGQLEHPLKWSMQHNLAWSQPIPGGGWSSPVVVGGRVFVTTAVDSNNTKPLNHAGGVRNMRGKKASEPFNFKLICIVLKDGSVEWETNIAVERPKFPIHPSNTYATESPVTNGKHVYCYFAAIGIVVAVDMSGKVVWTTDVGAFPGGNGFGTGSSLAYNNGRLFLQCDNDKDSFVLSLDEDTGNELWKRKRSSSTSWSSPLIWKNSKRTDLVVCGSGTVTGYNPITGKTNWRLTNVSTAFTASPASNASHIFLGNSSPRGQGPLIAINSQIQGESRLDISNLTKGVSWGHLQRGPGMASPVVSGGYLYVCSRGFLSCYSTQSGERIYKSRLPSAKSIAASTWANDKYVFLMDESGKTFVIESGSKFKVIHENQLDDLFWATPAVAKGVLLLRGANKLYCIKG